MFKDIQWNLPFTTQSHFLLFPQYFLPCQRENSSIQPHLFLRQQLLSIWTSLKFCCLVKVLTLSKTSPGFYVSAVQVFLKHCGKRRNCSLTSNFSFSHCVFYPFGELSAIFIRFENVVCKLFEFGRV